MEETRPQQPFKWSEIHLIAKEKLAALEDQIRKEVNENSTPIPEGGGARHQFFILLKEGANDWALRAKEMYDQCLKEIDRENAPGAKSAIWDHGLRFFISENIRNLMFVACGFGPRERELMSYWSKRLPTPSAVLAVRIKVSEIDRILVEISNHWEKEVKRISGTGWLQETNRLLAELGFNGRSVHNPLLESQPRMAQDPVFAGAQPTGIKHFDQQKIEQIPAPRGSAVKNPAPESKLGIQNGVTRGGRKRTRDPRFDYFVGPLWRKAQTQGLNGRVSQEALRHIAAELDSSEFSNPLEHLQDDAAKLLNAHNKQFGNSSKKLRTWADIVNGPPLLRVGVRKSLSNRAGIIHK